MFTNPRQTGWWIAVAVAIGLVCSSRVLAKKPPKPPGGGGGGGDVPAGTVYFQHDGRAKSMNADGSQKSDEAAGVSGSPSHAPHDGRRWFAAVKHALPQLYGLFATATYTDSGGDPVAEIVPLILPGDDGDWEVAWGNVRWVFNFQAALAGANGTDGMISWLAVRRADGEVVDSAICRAPVVFDADTGAITALDLTSVERFPVSSSDFDWSPEGTEIAFAYAKVISVYDTLSGTLVPLPMTSAVHPAWSPDGGQIAFVETEELEDRIKTIQLDNQSQATVTSVRRRDWQGDYLLHPHWSPDAMCLIYDKESWKPPRESSDVWRIGVDGKGNTNLTADIDTRLFTTPANSLGWR
jgi:hypothetical protein